MKLDIGKGTTQLLVAKLDNGKVVIQMNKLFSPEKIGSNTFSSRNIVMKGCTLMIHNTEGLEQMEKMVSKAREFLEEEE